MRSRSAASLGIGEKWVAIRVDQIDFPTDEQRRACWSSVTEEQLKNAPNFMTRAAVAAAEEATQAQQQPMDQQQIPAPTRTDQ